MASYILRGIDEQLWRQVKSKAALQGISLRALLEQLLRDWLASA